ncbi:hypothetical protein J6O48_11120 [bacterium]|nr:hypothetical protein [bacterium]
MKKYIVWLLTLLTFIIVLPLSYLASLLMLLWYQGVGFNGIFQHIVVGLMCIVISYECAKFIYKKFGCEDIKMSGNYIGICLGILFVFSLILFCLTEKSGNQNINSIFCKREFDFKGFVYAFPDGTKTKNYRLKADMYKDGDKYGIYTLYFNNGGCIDFDSCEDGNKNGDDFYCIPTKDNRDWYFKFYGEQIKNKK